jgi:hypothetical protein
MTADLSAAISTKDTQLKMVEVLGQLGVRKLALTLPATEGLPDSVDAKMSKFAFCAPSVLVHRSSFRPEIFSNIDNVAVFAAFILTQDQALGKAIYNDFLPEALKKGVIKPAPPAEVVGHGVGSIQKGVDVLKKGVSGKKIVVTL